MSWSLYSVRVGWRVCRLRYCFYRVICVYCDDSWDREAVGKVFKVLVEDLNLVSGAYKVSFLRSTYRPRARSSHVTVPIQCDANTILGIDSKHASGIRSSLWVKVRRTAFQ